MKPKTISKQRSHVVLDPIDQKPVRVSE